MEVHQILAGDKQQAHEISGFLVFLAEGRENALSPLRNTSGIIKGQRGEELLCYRLSVTHTSSSWHTEATLIITTSFH